MDFLFVGERLVVDLLNTVIAQDGRVRDLLGGRGAVAAWSAAAGVLPLGWLRLDRAGLAREPERLRGYREALRDGFVEWAGSHTPTPGLLALLNRYLARAPEVVELVRAGGKVSTRRRRGGASLDLLYGAVASSAAELLANGDPRRLRKCANPECRLMFYDVSKAGRRRWCSMQTCGARAKVRAFRERRATP